MTAAHSSVLVADDDPATVAIIATVLKHEGWAVDTAESIAAVKRACARHTPDLIVLDVSLPDGSGHDFCRSLHAAGSASPLIIMVSGRTAEHDRICGLAAGADDYVAKPFSPRELALRVRAVLRRNERGRFAATDDAAQDDAPEVVINEALRTVSVRGTQVYFTQSEYLLITELCRNPTTAMSRSRLADAIAIDHARQIDLRTIDAHVAHIRRRLRRVASDLELVTSVRGVGYRLASSVTSHILNSATFRPQPSFTLAGQDAGETNRSTHNV